MTGRIQPDLQRNSHSSDPRNLLRGETCRTDANHAPEGARDSIEIGDLKLRVPNIQGGWADALSAHQRPSIHRASRIGRSFSPYAAF